MAFFSLQVHPQIAAGGREPGSPKARDFQDAGHRGQGGTFGEEKPVARSGPARPIPASKVSDSAKLQPEFQTSQDSKERR